MCVLPSHALCHLRGSAHLTMTLQFPFACRLAAFTLFTPFGVCIILDIVAYGEYFPCQSYPFFAWERVAVGLQSAIDWLLVTNILGVNADQPARPPSFPAYIAIARTLHLTITPRRVPRSPPTLTSQILTEAGPVTEADSDSSSTASSSS